MIPSIKDIPPEHAMKAAAVIHDVREKVTSRVDSAIRSGGPDRGRRIALRLMDEVQSDLVKERQALACRRGCAACCHLKVTATAAEVFGILDYLESQAQPSVRDAVHARIRQAAAQVRAEGEGARLHLSTPCPLLADGQCTAYTVRPLMCRRHHSLDRGPCEETFADPSGDTAQRPANLLWEITSLGVIDGFHRGLRQHGFDADHWELITALEEALADPAARARHLAGDLAFLSSWREATA